MHKSEKHLTAMSQHALSASSYIGTFLKEIVKKNKSQKMKDKIEYITTFNGISRCHKYADVNDTHIQGLMGAYTASRAWGCADYYTSHLGQQPEGKRYT